MKKLYNDHRMTTFLFLQKNKQNLETWMNEASENPFQPQKQAAIS